MLTGLGHVNSFDAPRNRVRPEGVRQSLRWTACAESLMSSPTPATVLQPASARIQPAMTNSATRRVIALTFMPLPQLANVDEMAFDCRGGGHGRAHEVRATAR